MCKAIIQAGIKTVVYDCDKYADTASVIASKRMLNAAGVRYYKYERTGRTITIDIKKGLETNKVSRPFRTCYSCDSRILMYSLKGTVIDGGKKLVKLVKRIRHKLTAYNILCKCIA